MMNGFNRVFYQWTQALKGGSAAVSTRTADQDLTPESTPNWHGDHWQNLLACPMDARRYILEDWTEIRGCAADDNDDMRIDSFSGRRVRHFN